MQELVRHEVFEAAEGLGAVELLPLYSAGALCLPALWTGKHPGCAIRQPLVRASVMLGIATHLALDVQIGVRYRLEVGPCGATV